MFCKPLAFIILSNIKYKVWKFPAQASKKPPNMPYLYLPVILYDNEKAAMKDRANKIDKERL